MVENYLKELLFEYDCVVLPGFGGFITHHIGANIHPITHKAMPPSKKVAFNEQLKINDNLLTAYIADKEKISKGEALDAINIYIEKIQSELLKMSQYRFKDIGKIYFNVEQKIEFEPENKLNYLEDSFGLTPLYLKPMEENQNSQTVVRPAAERKSMKDNNKDFTMSEKSGASYKILFLIVPLVLCAAAGAFLFGTSEGNVYLSSMFPGSDSAKITVVEEVNQDEIEEQTIEEEIPTDIWDETPEVVELVEEPAAVQTDGGDYCIVVGAFQISENAYNLQNKLSAEGKKVSVIEPKSGRLYKVAFSGYSSREEATASLEQFHGEFGSDIWVMKK